MAYAGAVTNGSGLHMMGLIDPSGMKTEGLDSQTFDPWALLSTAKYSYGEFGDFFAEDHLGDLIDPKMSKYNLLANHVRRELGVKDSEEVGFLSKGAARSIKARGREFLIWGGKVYHRGKAKAVVEQ